MKHWPKNDRPRERLLEFGPQALADSELLALVLGTGTGRENAVELARKTLVKLGGLEKLRNSGFSKFLKISGMGEVKASRIIASIELGIRTIERESKKRFSGRVANSVDIYEIYKSRLNTYRQEVFMVVGLNNKNEPVHEIVVARGTLTECHVDPREIFRPMIIESAARVILIHNHPSGDPNPSHQDVAFTRRMIEAGKILKIPVLDHIVIGRNEYFSMRDMGIVDIADG